MIIPYFYLNSVEIKTQSIFVNSVEIPVQGSFMINAAKYDFKISIFDGKDNTWLFRGETNGFYKYLVETKLNKWGYFSVVSFRKHINEYGKLLYIEFFFNDYEFLTNRKQKRFSCEVEDYIHRYLVPYPRQDYKDYVDKFR